MRLHDVTWMFGSKSIVLLIYHIDAQLGDDSAEANLLVRRRGLAERASAWHFSRRSSKWIDFTIICFR